mmetsp:Transcript_50318/g.93028  ORF Transcript_50318/g.93028 Transcript_50318/m.93028 type:complete len:216 (-) Transcript_50318:107-754(-)
MHSCIWQVHQHILHKQQVSCRLHRCYIAQAELSRTQAMLAQSGAVSEVSSICLHHLGNNVNPLVLDMVPIQEALVPRRPMPTANVDDTADVTRRQEIFQKAPELPCCRLSRPQARVGLLALQPLLVSINASKALGSTWHWSLPVTIIIEPRNFSASSICQHGTLILKFFQGSLLAKSFVRQMVTICCKTFAGGNTPKEAAPSWCCSPAQAAYCQS